MPKLIIDNITVEAADGITVLEAAQSVGINIPHFCWHPALGKAGACRVCAVKILEGPVKGIQMSCMLPAQEGMVVSTTDEEALAMRRQVIEWLMINHPHDCPVCDEGGECQLQDFTIAGGHGIRRYDGNKRTHVNQYLGPQIEHEMNRCIQCYRCARFYQEFAGGTDFGVMGSASRVYFGRFADGPLESPFSGNLVDICPTGVFTDKTARFRARYWDYDMAPSVCPHCSLGCNTTPAARYRELLKTMARRNDKVNGWFICDRGRFSNSAVNAPDRPRHPLVDGRAVEWDEALDDLQLRISEIEEIYGPGSMAIVGSSRLSMEAAVLLPKLYESTAAGTLCYFVDESEADQSIAAVSHLNTTTSASMADVHSADLIVILNCNLLEQGPMMALAVRQAWRKGARVYLLDQKKNLPPKCLDDVNDNTGNLYPDSHPPFQGEGQGGDGVEGNILANRNNQPHPHPNLPLEGEGTKKPKSAILPIVADENILPFEFASVSTLDEVQFSGAKKPVIISGTDCKEINNLPDGTKLACLLNGPNAFGVAVLSREHNAVTLAKAVAGGKVKGVIAVEADIPAELLKGIPFVAALDWRNTDTVKAARIVLPTTAWVEMDGTYINNEGRAQRFRKVMNPGLPIKGLDPAVHPPRTHAAMAPGGDLRPAWKVVAEIIERLEGERIVKPFSGKWEQLRELNTEGQGVSILDT